MLQVNKLEGHMNNHTKTRDTFPDSIRGVAIYLVVLGHFIEPYINYGPTKILYLSIYLFHMPLFVFMSGIFSKKILTEKDYKGIIYKLFLPLIVFHFLYTVFVYLYPSGYGYGPLAPHSIMWFLLSLITWKLLLPLFRSPAGLLISLGSALAAGYFGQIGYDFSAARTIYFFPFFIIGSLYGSTILKYVTKYRAAFCGIFILALIIGVFWFHNGLNQIPLYGSKPYVDKGIVIDGYPALGRLLLMTLSAIALVGFCGFIPTSSKILQHLGTSSIAIYLLHQFFVLGVNGKGWKYISNPILLLLACVVVSIVLCFALSYARPWLEKAMYGVALPFRWLNSQFMTRT